MPDFQIEDVEDAYTYYVMILGVSEELFWNADIAFLRSVVENKSAFDGWKSSEERKRMNRAKKSISAKHRRR